MTKKGYKQTKEHKRKVSEALQGRIPWNKGRRGKNSSNWKGGKFVNGGYWSIWKPNHPRSSINGRINEHILIAENMLGRYLTKEERVHHIDGDKLNNKPDNLFVCKSNSDHRYKHLQLEQISYELIKNRIIKFSKEKGAYFFNEKCFSCKEKKNYLTNIILK